MCEESTCICHAREENSRPVVFVVESGIPVPPTGKGRYLRGKYRRPKYPWDEMEIGDSFFYDGKRSTVDGNAGSRGRQTGEYYISRAVMGGTRIWRVA